MNSPPPITHRRWPLFTKIVGGFVVIIVVMAGLSLTVFYQLKPLFSADRAEFIILPLVQDLEILFGEEQKSAEKFFETHDTFDARTLAVITREFQVGLDSLRRTVDREDMRTALDTVIADHGRYTAIVQAEIARVNGDPRLQGNEVFAGLQPLRDTVRHKLHSVSEIYLPTLGKSLKKITPRASDAMSTGYWILVLTSLIALVAAFYLARTFTQPIQALKSGTEKVGEGHYETVAVTSNDEIADLTRAFNLMSEKLRHLDEMRMQLMSEISHEMRTPLQVIKAGCYSIVHSKEGGPLTQRQREAVAMIHTSTNRINQFVNSFLDVAKMEAGLMKFKFEESDLVEMIGPLVQEAQLIGQTRQIRVALECGEIPRLMIDRERVGQVFSNLLSNALKYTPDAGSITIRIARSDERIGGNGQGSVRIDVQDTGVGIPEADLQKLFNKFYQAKNVPLVNEKGSGLGLALVKHVAEAHGGKVSVTSKVGEGSTFSVVLPA